MSEIAKQAEAVLKHNDLGNWTRPVPGVYPHQWLWDSCFIAMGWANFNVKRAETEILSLLRGQWRNGMMPHMIFSGDRDNSKHLPKMWDSRLSPYAPDDVATSGITQPPLVAQAVSYIGQKMSASQRKRFYKKVLPHLVAYHTWLYEERDPHNQGLVILIHPWETGLDDTPPWMEAMHSHSKPLWIKLIELSRADKIIEKLRRDTRQMPADERASTVESLMLYNITRRLRRKAYDSDKIMAHSHFLIEDLFFNAILIRNNQLLKNIASEVRVSLPNNLLSSMNKASKALDELWDDKSELYFSRYFISRDFILQPTIATLMPLYSGAITKKRAEKLVELLHRHDMFAANYPIPTVPLSSPHFHHRRYWQGPTWLNTNWLVYDGLLRYGYLEEAELIKRKSLELIAKSGFHEYFSSVDGYGAGVVPFSWTAALALVLEKA